jgi:hypothetical protein
VPVSAKHSFIAYFQQALASFGFKLIKIGFVHEKPCRTAG